MAQDKEPAPFTPGRWEYVEEERGDPSVGMQGCPATITAFIQPEGAVDEEAVEILEFVAAPGYRVPADPDKEFDEGWRGMGTVEGNARRILNAIECVGVVVPALEALLQAISGAVYLSVERSEKVAPVEDAAYAALATVKRGMPQ